MEDHFVLHVDNLLREEAAAERRNLSEENPKKKDINGAIDELQDCRICHDEDEAFNMETPCSCCGTMKYAHRKCVQRWCDEKGDITCEICRQPFQPGYNAPSKPFLHGRTAMDLLATETAPSEYEEYNISRRRSIAYCRSIAVICLLLLLLREALAAIINGSEQFSLQTFMVQLLKTSGIVLTLYAMLRAVTIFQCCQQLQQQETSEISTLGRA